MGTNGESDVAEDKVGEWVKAAEVIEVEGIELESTKGNACDDPSSHAGQLEPAHELASEHS